MPHITIYRDSIGTPQWATVTNADSNSPSLIEGLHNWIQAAQVGDKSVLALESYYTVEVV